jgi:membrane-bound serine protease (ClpP class)
MRPILVALLLIFNLQSLFGEPLKVVAQKKLIYVFPVMENIGPGIWRQTIKAFAEADSLKADVILLHMNTYGGTVLDADSMRTKVLNSRIPVYVFIDNNAASAGALISIACDSIYMREGANMGAATVVNETGQAMPDKYQSYMRSIMRSTAEAQGKDTVFTGKDTLIQWRRDPKIAEAMVDPDVYIKGIIDTGKVLTMTPTEAINYGFCEGVRKDVSEVIEKAGVRNYEIREYQKTWLDKLIGFLVNPIVSGLLIMAMIGGIYFELQSPGIAFPIGLAIVAAILYFAPLYIEGLAANWEIIIFIVGFVLLAIEILIIPGFGVFGISGILLMVSGLILSLLNNMIFDFDGVEPARVSSAIATVLISVLVAFFGSIWASSKLFTARKGVFAGFALNTTIATDISYVGLDKNEVSLIGKTGFAQTVLRLSGKVSVEGNVYDAMSEGPFINKGEKVRITRHEAGQVYVVRENG